MGLRTKKGVSNPHIAKFLLDILHNKDLESSVKLKRLIQNNLLLLDEKTVRVTSSGLSVLNGILGEISQCIDNFHDSKSKKEEIN